VTAAAEPHPERWITRRDREGRVTEVRNPITRSVAALAHPVAVERFPALWPAILLYLHRSWVDDHEDPKVIEVAP
jgi:hypothetical protein